MLREREIKREKKREESQETMEEQSEECRNEHPLILFFAPYFSLSTSLLSITSEFSSFAANFVTVSFKFYKAFRDEKDVMNPPAPVSSLPAELS